MEFRHYTQTCISWPAFLSLEYFTKHIPLQSALLPILTESRRISVASVVHVGWAPSVLSSVMHVIFVECRGGEIYHSSCSTCNALLINAFALHVFSRHGSCFFFVSLFGVSILRTVYRKCDPGGGVTDPVVVDVHFGDLNVGRSSTCFGGKQWDSLQSVSVACFFCCKGEVTNIYAKLGYNCYSLMFSKTAKGLQTYQLETGDSLQ